MKAGIFSILVLLALACSAPAQSSTEIKPTKEPAQNSAEVRPTKEPTPRPGEALVYQRIEALTDCRALQAEFNQADANGKRDRERGALDLSRISTSYMEAAAKRMKAVGC